MIWHFTSVYDVQGDISGHEIQCGIDFRNVLDRADNIWVVKVALASTHDAVSYHKTMALVLLYLLPGWQVNSMWEQWPT